jgi:deoxyribose-phosphate aldolase
VPDDNDRDNVHGRMRDAIDLASYFDAALLKTETTAAEIEKLCEEAVRYHFKAVFVNPAYVKFCRNLLDGTGVRIGSVSGFPLGATTTEVKIYEAQENENHGADEIDMVANIGAIKSGDFSLFEKDVAGVRKALGHNTTMKVILEASLLTKEEKIKAANICVDCGADFVKTSTGMFGQATIADVMLLFETVGRKIGVKASGGIRSLQQTLAMIEAGASRIGTSSGGQIIEELKSHK